MVIKLKCSNLKSLDSDDRLVLDRLNSEYYEKIKRLVGKEPEIFDIHLKCHKKEGNAKRYIIKTKFLLGKFNFETSVEDWKLKDAIHKSMRKLITEIEHKVVKEKKKTKAGKGN